ncbi:hypothetical protein [Sphaerochaeta pleomorpha]|nr:hypothetical protein [Sphaerochaeta pleomorpha]
MVPLPVKDRVGIFWQTVIPMASKDKISLSAMVLSKKIEWQSH